MEFLGLGLHADFASAVAAMTHVAATVRPDPANRRLHDRLFTRVYRPLYTQLQPLYKEIRAITGYPR